MSPQMAVPTDLLSRKAVRLGEDDAVHAILDRLCLETRMGFACVARVTKDRWIACQVIDRVDFGLEAGSELEIGTTICQDVRRSGEGVIIDSVADDPDWRTHPVPILYGFESYVSVPIRLDDGSFFGTLCAIDPQPRSVRAPDLVAKVTEMARELGRMFSSRQSMPLT